MFQSLPPAMLSLLFALPALSHASPQPALIKDDFAMSLVPRNTLFLRQLSNLQTFNSALGGAAASAITNSGDAERPFSVDGQTFDSFDSAAQRSCDNQFQACQGAANGNGGNQANTNNGQQRNQNQNQNQNQNNGNNNNNGQNRNQNQNQGNGNQNQNNNGRNRNKNRRRMAGEGNETDFEFESEFELDFGVQKRQQFTVNQCDQQKDQCKSAQQAATVKDFQTAVASENIGPDPLFPDFDLICEG